MKYATAFVAFLFLLGPQIVAAGSSPTLERIKQTGTVRIGFRESEPPMSFLDEDKISGCLQHPTCFAYLGIGDLPLSYFSPLLRTFY